MLYPKGTWDRWEIGADPNTGKYSEKHWKDFLNEQYQNIKLEPLDETFGVMMASLGTNTKLKDEFVKRLKSEGYNAMQDLAGVGRDVSVIEGIEPLIVFDPENNLTEGTSKKVTEKEKEKAEKEFLKWQKTARTHY